MSFAHLHLHTEYSILDGVHPPEALVGAALARGQNAIAITDHGTMFGVPSFARAAAKKGIKPLIGCEAYILDQFDLGERGTGAPKTHHITLLAQNQVGYTNLCRLITKAHLKGFYRKPRLHLGWLEARAEGIIVLSGCMQGILGQAILEDRREHYRERAGWFREVFKNRFFLEVMDHDLPQEQQIAKTLFELAKKDGYPVVATNDVHFIEKGGNEAQDLLLAIRSNAPLNDENRWKAELDNLHLTTEEEMKAIFPDHKEAVFASQEIADRIDDLSSLFSDAEPIFPAVEVPKPHTDSMTWLRGLSRKGLESLGVNGKDATTRLNDELGVIDRLGYADYFLVVRDFIAFARQEGIPVGPGRGSAAGSLVAFSLGITQVNPLDYGLLFERFLNEGRKSLPDIDTDFCTLRREEVLNHIRETHGETKVAQIVTFNRLKGRLAFRDMARLSGIPEGRYGPVAKALIMGEELDDTKENEVVMSMLKKDDECAEAMEKAKKVENTIRNRGVHAAGLVVGRETLSNLVPLARDKSGAIISQYEMGDLERMGLVKMDVLGIRNLTLLDKAQEEILRCGGVCDLENLPDGDAKAFAILAKGDTDGVFQFEAPNAVRLLKQVKPRSIEDLAVVNALIRPGPMNAGLTQRYVRRRRKKEKPTPPHPALEGILKDTLGVMVYQEQVMLMAREIAGFSLVDADDLRKAMGKKKKEVMDAQRSRFIEGAKKVGMVKPRAAKKLFDEVAEFAQYGFNKSHAVAYAIVAYQCAWLKAHFPAPFHAALLSSFGGNAEKVGESVSRLRSRGVEVLPPHVNTSEGIFSVAKGGAIRFGLGSIRHFGEGAAEALVTERALNGPYPSVQEFVERCSDIVNKRAAESLAASGAFEGMGFDRRRLVCVMEDLYRDTERNKGNKNQMMLLEEMEAVRVRDPSAEELAVLPSEGALEYGALDCFLTTDPLGQEGLAIRERGLLSLKESAKKKSKVKVVGFLSGSSIRSFGGKKVAEGMIQDDTNRFEWVMFGDGVANLERDDLENGLVVAEGVFKKGRDARPRLTISALWPRGIGVEIQRKKPSPPLPPIELFLPSNLDETALGQLARLVRQMKPGGIRVELHFECGGRFELTSRVEEASRQSLVDWSESLK